MARKNHFKRSQARYIGEQLNITWDTFDVKEFHKGLEVELEHGYRDMLTDVTHNDPILTGKIALAHLKEFPDYYTRLEKMEKEAKAFWKTQVKVQH